MLSGFQRGILKLNSKSIRRGSMTKRLTTSTRVRTKSVFNDLVSQYTCFNSLFSFYGHLNVFRNNSSGVSSAVQNNVSVNPTETKYSSRHDICQSKLGPSTVVKGSRVMGKRTDDISRQSTQRSGQHNSPTCPDQEVRSLRSKMAFGGTASCKQNNTARCEFITGRG